VKGDKIEGDKRRRKLREREFKIEIKRELKIKRENNRY
jgi:hypothetical protein